MNFEFSLQASTNDFNQACYSKLVHSTLTDFGTRSLLEHISRIADCKVGSDLSSFITYFKLFTHFLPGAITRSDSPNSAQVETPIAIDLQRRWNHPNLANANADTTNARNKPRMRTYHPVHKPKVSTMHCRKLLSRPRA